MSTTPPELNVDRPAGLLTRLFRAALLDLNVSPGKWQALIERYLSDRRRQPSERPPSPELDHLTLMNAVMNRDMSSTDFRTGLQLLGCKEARLQLTLRFPDGRGSTHTVQLNFDEPAPRD